MREAGGDSYEHMMSDTRYAFNKSLSTLITLLTSPMTQLSSHSSLSVVCVPSLPEQTGL